MILVSKPKSILLGKARVLRGGGWLNLGRHCRSAYRLRFVLGIRYDYYGLRLILRKKSNSNTRREKQ